MVTEDYRGYRQEKFSQGSEAEVVTEYVIGSQIVLKLIVDQDGEPLQTVVQSIDFIAGD